MFYAEVNFLLLYFVLDSTVVSSGGSSKFTDIIQENLEVQKNGINDYIIDVIFEEIEICKICMTYGYNKKALSINKLYALYTAMNCQFAQWTFKIIHYFIQKIPELTNEESFFDGSKIDRSPEYYFKHYQNILKKILNALYI